MELNELKNENRELIKINEEVKEKYNYDTNSNKNLINQIKELKKQLNLQKK